jgi:glycosyltransferase involved in cell wall biosynthesis
LIDDGKSGMLFNSTDPSDLAKKIISYVTVSSASNDVGQTARHFVEENFSSASNALKVLDLYIRTLQQTS